MNKWWRGGLLAVLVATLMLSMSYTARQTVAQAADDPAAALEILAQLNDWRLAAGLSPLKPDDTLKAMALDQAGYLSSLPEIEGGNAMHLGRNGEGVRDRALYPQFNWPTYGGFAAISEVGAVGTLESAVEFWKNSDIHTETILNPGFREVGVAAVPHVWGHVYIVVLASRPDVLPALLDPRGGSLYLSQDNFKYGAGNVPPMRVMLFDSSGRPLNDGAWLDWSPVIPVPADLTGTLYVLYDDNGRHSMSAVNVGLDRAVLPGFVPAVAAPG